jgi:cell wall-associated NlpC family hydrolase
MQVGAAVEVTDDGVRLRSGPGVDAGIIREMASGERAVIVGGPQEASGMTWWQITLGGQEGWTAEQLLREVTIPAEWGLGSTTGEVVGGAAGAALRDRIIAIAAEREGVPYEMPPNPPATLDCSMYVLVTFNEAGLRFPDDVRTAEQIRQACVPVDLGSVEPGDLLFFEHTYEPGTDPGPDLKLATHVGISLGSGTHRMWNAVESQVTGIDAVQITNVNTPWWTPKLFEARRHPKLAGQ